MSYKAPTYTAQQLKDWGMTPESFQKLRLWMSRNWEGYENSTQLAEAAADEFEHLEWLDDETHPVWEVALEFDPDPELDSRYE